MMEEWSNQLLQALETAAAGAEQWTQSLAESASQQLEVGASAIADWSEDLAQQIEANVNPEIDRWTATLQDWIEPLEAAIAPEIERMANQLDETVSPFLEQWVTDIDRWAIQVSVPFNQTVDPLVNQHAVCVGCCHYHGQGYGHTTLVCGMYPYGPDQEQCPDWESTWKN